MTAREKVLNAILQHPIDGPLLLELQGGSSLDDMAKRHSMPIERLKDRLGLIMAEIEDAGQIVARDYYMTEKYGSGWVDEI